MGMLPVIPSLGGILLLQQIMSLHLLFLELSYARGLSGYLDT